MVLWSGEGSFRVNIQNVCTAKQYRTRRRREGEEEEESLIKDAKR